MPKRVSVGYDPPCYGAKSTVHEHFQRWARAKDIPRILLTEYGETDPDRCPMAGSGRFLVVSANAPSKKTATEGLGVT